MAENSKIEWTHHTFNSWYGCQKVGAPCDNCYAESWADRFGMVQWGPHAERRRSSPAMWRLPLKWDAAAKAAGERHRVFSLSLGDWLDNQAPQQWRLDLADLIEATPNLDWLLLTKRIQNFERLAPWTVAPFNVWLGITCGDQDDYERDWPILAGIRAPVRFISYEPALGPLRIVAASPPLPNWIICGGESGPNARPMNPEWARALRDDCRLNGVAFFFKQWGEWLIAEGQPEPEEWLYTFQDGTEFGNVSDGADIMLDAAYTHRGKPEKLWRDLWATGEGHLARRVGKHRAGRLLDGCEYSEFPRHPIANEKSIAGGG